MKGRLCSADGRFLMRYHAGFTVCLWACQVVTKVKGRRELRDNLKQVLGFTDEETGAGLSPLPVDTLRIGNSYAMSTALSIVSGYSSSHMILFIVSLLYF